ncbi:MAG: class I SAM-dependent methyltransferase [Proteobacteria bacterium]|nr:class I SAM-dependent methyltransferase [Pseudomonadota bacterium]NDC24634.1 class I SAM-dependent methyltransferase [Pseudomonadota bacterium]NDD03405.1 class I SAM-dependent methyltransferase [Pseudomonadota bacterium]NDG26984.1 class I SAM-dependent methyltransferase [Pseudomonadota bacterium]
MRSLKPQCLLCEDPNAHSLITKTGRSFFKCPNCELIYLDPSQKLSPEEEKARYETHENDVTDPKYREFVQPLVNAISKQITPGSLGLDFGAGTGPILASLFRENGFEMNVYDPFFWPDASTLDHLYDFVAASEVVEHFSNPQREFLLLRQLLKPGGILGLMTLLYDDETDIQSWYYLKDPTHICAYSKKTLEWIRKQFGFGNLETFGTRTILFFCPETQESR